MPIAARSPLYAHVPRPPVRCHRRCPAVFDPRTALAGFSNIIVLDDKVDPRTADLTRAYTFAITKQGGKWVAMAGLQEKLSEVSNFPASK